MDNNHICMTDYVIPVYNYLDRCIDELYQNSSNSQPVLKFRRKFKTTHIKSSNCSNSVKGQSTNKVSEVNGKKYFSTENRNLEDSENGSLLSHNVLMEKKHFSNENLNYDKYSESGKLLPQAVMTNSKKFDQRKDFHKQNIQKNVDNSYLQQFAVKREGRIGTVNTQTLKGDPSYLEISSTKPRIEPKKLFSRYEQESFCAAATENIIHVDSKNQQKSQAMDSENQLKSYFAPHNLNQVANMQQKGKKDDNSPHIPRGKLEERINSKPKNHKDMHRKCKASRKEEDALNRRPRVSDGSKQHAMKTDRLHGHSSRHKRRHDKEYREKLSYRIKKHQEKSKHRKHDGKTLEKSPTSDITIRIDKDFKARDSVRKTSQKVVSLENKIDGNKIDKPFLTRPYSKSSKKEKVSHKGSRNGNTKYSYDEKSKKKGSFEKSYLRTDHKEAKSYNKNSRTDKHRRTRGAVKNIQEQQKRTKELTTVYQNMQDKILQKHLEGVRTTNNVYDCLHVMDEKVDLISSEDDVLPKSQATEWSNGEKQYSLSNNNQSKHGFHYGGIWKSITREKV